MTLPRRLPTLLLGVLLLAGAAWILYIARDAQFWSDDFAFVVFRQGHAPHILLGSFNGHFAFFPIVSYKILLALFGMHHYWPYRLVVLVVHLVALVMVYAYARRRVGDWAALAAVALLIIYGAAVELYVYPVNLGFQLAIATGLGALLLLDEPTTRPRAIWATVLLTIGIASSTVALPFALATIVDVARRAERRALWWVPAIPLGVYVLWSLKYGDGQLIWRNTGQVWGYTMIGIARSTGGLVALDENWGRALAAVLLGVILWRASRVDRLVALVAGLFGFWALTAMARAQLGTEGAERFLYPSAVLLVVILAETARGVRLPQRLAVVAPLAVIGIVVANGFSSHNSADAISDIGQTTSGGLRALALATPDAITPTTVPPLPYYGANAGQLAAAVRRFGTPGGAPSSLPSSSGSANSGADTMLRAVAPAPSAPSPDGVGAPGPLRGTGLVARTRGGCLIATPSGQTTLTLTRLPATGLTIRNDGTTPVTVTTRRFAAFGAQPDLTVAPGAARQLHLKAAPGTPPWSAAIGAAGPFRVCTPSR